MGKQGGGGRDIGEGDLAFAQVRDHVFGAGLVPGVEAAAGAPPALSFGGPGEHGVQRGQVRRIRFSRMQAFADCPGCACWRWCGRGDPSIEPTSRSPTMTAP